MNTCYKCAYQIEVTQTLYIMMEMISNMLDDHPFIKDNNLSDELQKCFRNIWDLYQICGEIES